MSKYFLIILIFLSIGCNNNIEKSNRQNNNLLAQPIKKESKKENEKKDKQKVVIKKKKDKPKIVKKTKPPTHSSTSHDPISINYNSGNYASFHEEAKAFCKKKRFNKDYYFLLDYSLPSGKNRFFIYSFKTDSIIDSRLVTHGACDVFQENNLKWDSASFSDQPSSHCSSKGKYKIGKRAYSGWGINVKYWLHGLENTNKSAERRVVVLHSWDLVSNEEIYPSYSPLSWGCPAVSNEFMVELDSRLSKSRKPVLLWEID